MSFPDLRYFTRHEKWGDPDKMDEGFLNSLDLFRHQVRLPFRVLEGYATEGHSPKSYHYLGRAVDGRFHDDKEGKPLSLRDHVFLAMIAPFGGVGIYTWGSGGAFLHLDDRTMNGRKVIWVSQSPQNYEPLTPKLLHKLTL